MIWREHIVRAGAVEIGDALAGGVTKRARSQPARSARQRRLRCERWCDSEGVGCCGWPHPGSRVAGPAHAEHDPHLMDDPLQELLAERHHKFNGVARRAIFSSLATPSSWLPVSPDELQP